jgi:hypothetical protein
MSASLTSEQSKWLAGLVQPAGAGKGAVANQSDAATTRLKTREDMLDGVLAEIGKIRGKLATAMQGYELITGGGDTMKLLTGDLNPDDEIDTRHDVRQGSSIKDPNSLKAIQPLYEILVTQSAVLRDARSASDGTLSGDASGDPLFTEADIADEIWTPLVRAGVLPENLVQKRYSEVAKLFAGAQEAYGKRLEAFSEQAEKKNELADNLGLGSEAVSSIGKIAEGAMSGLLALQGASEDTKKSVKGGIEIIAAIGANGLSVAQAVVKGVDAPSLLQAAIAGVKMAIGGSELVEATQKILTKGIDAGVHAGSFVQSLLKGETDAAIGSLADAIAGSLDTASEYYDNPGYAQIGGRIKGIIKTSASAKKLHGLVAAGGPELIDGVSDLVKEAGDLMVHEIKSSVENAKRLETEQKQKEITDELDGKLKLAQRSIEKITGDCFSVSKVPQDIDEIVNSAQMAEALEANKKLTAKWRELLCAAARGRDPQPIGEAFNELLVAANTKLVELEKLRQEVAKSVAKAKEASDKLAPAPEEGGGEEEPQAGEEANSSDKVKEIMAQLAAANSCLQPEDALIAGAEAKARLEKIEADSRAFGQTLSHDFTAAMNETDNSVQQARLAVTKLAPMLEQIKRDKAYLKLADTLATVGVNVGKAMFEKLGPLGSFKECATSIYTAVGHMRELGKWEESMADGRNAGASGLVAAEFNRAGLEKHYRNADWLNAAIKAVETLGGALQVTGIAAPVATVLEGTAKIGGETAKLVTKFFDAGALKAAWTKYQKALEDPEDRKNVREALRSNATLSKYALAWAAVVARDPLARDAMNRIGLSDAVLGEKDTDAQAVVEYLEAVYDRDPVVLQASGTREDWWPGKPVLSSRSWIKFLKAAEMTEPGLEGETGILITQLLVRMEKLVPAEFPQPIVEEAVKKARAALDELIEVLADYHPVDGDREPHDGMRKVAEILKAQAELRRRRLPASLVVTP